MFDPKVIKVATDFAKIKVSPQNTEAVFETYGEIKNIATNAATNTISKPIAKKSFLSLDVTINAVNVLIYFDPLKKNEACWSLVLGQTRIFTDPETLKKPDFRYDEPMEKYCMSLSGMSFSHHPNKHIFYETKHSKIFNDSTRVIDDFGMDFEAELFQ